MSRCEATSEVDELGGVDDGGGRNGGYGCAEFGEERGLFEGLVVRHADVREVSTRTAEHSKGDASRAHGAFVNDVARVGTEKAIGFCLGMGCQ